MAPPKLPILNPVGGDEPPLPRAIVQYLTDLDQWARQIDGQAVRWGTVPPGGSYIQSPTILAGVIRNLPNAASKAGMTEDFFNQHGYVTDTTGTVRAEWGNLKANGVSAAQEGFRANDASGNPIFDSLGLISVMQRIAFADAVQNQNITGTGSLQNLTLAVPANASYTLTRSIHVLVMGTIVGLTTGASGQYCANQVNDTSAGPGGPGVMGVFDKRNTGYTQGVGWYIAGPVAPGTYSVELQVNPDIGQTVSVNIAHADVFLLGS